jgi:glycosyltransferase involved in cell wall biosynthesis
MAEPHPLSPELSVVVPVHREAEQIDDLVAAVSTQLDPLGGPWELILVDDGSPDGTWRAIESAAGRHPCLRGLRLSRNFGKEAALCAGLDAARGRAVIVMDGDLQHPPSLIPEMVRLWRETDADVVEAVKRTRGREPLLLRCLAHAFYRILEVLAGFDLRGASDFKLLDRRVVEAWLRMNERHVFFRGMIAWLGFRRARVAFDVPDRRQGSSSWSVPGRFRLALTAVTGFSSKLLHVVSLCGLLFLVLAAVMAVQTVYLKLTGRAVSGFSTVILLLLIIGSLLMISLGVIGLYLSRIYEEIKGRPRYIVTETLESPAAGARRDGLDEREPPAIRRAA